MAVTLNPNLLLAVPLAPLAELPVRADRMSLAYRRYLRELDFAYGVT